MLSLRQAGPCLCQPRPAGNFPGPVTLPVNISTAFAQRVTDTSAPQGRRECHHALSLTKRDGERVLILDTDLHWLCADASAEQAAGPK